jgi:PRTRC genetic system protein A
MFKIFINDGTNPLPNDNIYYIIGKQGVFLKKTMGLIDSIIKVDKISILNDVQETAALNVSKIPTITFSKIIKFYKDIYEKYHGEAVVLLYYNQTRKWFKLQIPNQNVTGGSAIYENRKTIENYQLIGTIHSHGSMSAFHSSVDDNDERNFDGLHITVGRVTEVNLDISCSVVVNGKRFILDPLNYIAGISKVPSPEARETDCRYQLNGPLFRYNKKWLRKVNKRPILIGSEKPKESITADFDNLYSEFHLPFDSSYDSIVRQYYFGEDVDDEKHPCIKCPRFDIAKERFEKDFIEEYGLEEEEDEDKELLEETFGDLDSEFLEKIGKEFSHKKR